jgi:hypothetical protein
MFNLAANNLTTNLYHRFFLGETLPRRLHPAVAQLNGG